MLSAERLKNAGFKPGLLPAPSTHFLCASPELFLTQINLELRCFPWEKEIVTQTREGQTLGYKYARYKYSGVLEPYQLKNRPLRRETSDGDMTSLAPAETRGS